MEAVPIGTDHVESATMPNDAAQQPLRFSMLAAFYKPSSRSAPTERTIAETGRIVKRTAATKDTNLLITTSCRTRATEEWRARKLAEFTTQENSELADALAKRKVKDRRLNLLSLATSNNNKRPRFASL